MASPSPFDCDRRATVTGLVLAGGMARRMGGGDKGLVPLAGRPMVEHVVDALRPQVGTILLSASRNHERYAALGYPVIADALGGYQGPLAGVATALRYCTSEFLVTVPCDAPLLPADLVQRLLAACEASNADVAVASDGERQQPVFLLARARVAPALEAYLAGGGRRVDAWLGRVRAAVADFGDEPHAFVNVNDPDERERVEALLLATAGVDSCDRPGHGHLPLQFEEARARMIAAIAPVVGQEVVGLRDALGRVLARDLHSPLDVPSHRNSAMDGYALAGSDLPPQGYASLEVVGTSWAGRAYAGAVAPGQCVRIMTGAMLPDATDTVVMQEQVRLENGRVVIEGGHRPGENVRPVGEDIRRGDLALAAGAVLRPAHLGVLASLGVDQVSVRRRPRVAIFSTGDELVAIGEVLAPGQIYDSNRYTLHGMLTRLPFEVIDLGVVKDTREDTLQAFETAAARADAVITSGGVSVGDADYVTETLERHGQVGFWKVAMKPGKPIAFGRFRQAFFFGLPGNPVSAMVTFYQLVRPALLALAGAVDADPPIIVRAACATRLRKHPGRLEFQRGVLERLASGAYTVRSTGHQGAGVLRSMSEANCFIILPLEQGDVEPGTEVEVQPFAGLV